MSEIICPYCKQSIPEESRVCPCCTSKLKKYDYKKMLLPLGTVMLFLWAISNIMGLILIQHHPQVLTMKDKDGYLAFPLYNYINICVSPYIITIIPFIIAIVQKYKTKLSVICLVTGILMIILFIGYFIHLEKLAGL